MSPAGAVRRATPAGGVRGFSPAVSAALDVLASDGWAGSPGNGLIEAADSPADESWRNINGIDDLARDIITTTDRVVVSALRGSAGAGGVFLALAADEVWACENIVLNPHYKDMGNLYGSEYWTYLLPRRVGEKNAAVLTDQRMQLHWLTSRKTNPQRYKFERGRRKIAGKGGLALEEVRHS